MGIAQPPVIRGSPLRRAAFWIRIIYLVLIGLFVVAYWSEVRMGLRMFWGVLRAVFGAPQTVNFADPAFVQAGQTLWLNLIIFGIVFIVTVFVVAPAILPVNGFRETWRTAFLLILHILGLDGPVVFVRGGTLVATEEDEGVGMGVVVIDFESAVVFEEEIPPPTLSNLLFIGVEVVLTLLGLYDPFQSPRVCGAGIVFTRRFERIRSVVDLRRQTRSLLDQRAYTRDGIETQAIVWAIFSLGQDPALRGNAREVTFIGSRRAENLALVTLTEVNDQPGFFRVDNIIRNNPLEPADREEIFAYLNSRDAQRRRDLRQPFDLLPPLPQQPVFDAARVFAAVSTQARNPAEALVPWSDVPLMVGNEIYRTLMQECNYDDIFNPNGPSAVSLVELNDRFNRRLRSLGMVSFRYVGLMNGDDLRVGGVYPRQELICSPVVPLQPRPNTLLRQRGIYVLFGGITQLRPVWDAVLMRRLDNWRAALDSQSDILAAQHQLHAAQASAAAQAPVQQNLAASLSQIITASNNEEAMALSVMQAIVAATSDPETQALLPGDVVHLLRSVQAWLTADVPTTPPTMI